jgi:hypothetical protein
MSILVSDGLHTSNDLLERLIAEHAPGAALTHQIVSKDRGSAEPR